MNGTTFSVTLAIPFIPPIITIPTILTLIVYLFQHSGISPFRNVSRFDWESDK